MEDYKRTIAVDFDGVINSYKSGWTGEGDLPDPPVDGAIEWLNEMWKHFHVVIFTCRADSQVGIDSVYTFLKKHGAPCIDVVLEKPHADLYIDDRGWRFNGDNFPSVEDVNTTTPWTKKTSEREKAFLTKEMVKDE